MKNLVILANDEPGAQRIFRGGEKLHNGGLIRIISYEISCLIDRFKSLVRNFQDWHRSFHRHMKQFSVLALVRTVHKFHGLRSPGITVSESMISYNFKKGSHSVFGTCAKSVEKMMSLKEGI